MSLYRKIISRLHREKRILFSSGAARVAPESLYPTRGAAPPRNEGASKGDATMPQVICANPACHKIFYASQSRLNDGHGRFCSSACYWTVEQTQERFVVCENPACGKTFITAAHRVKYCSRLCQKAAYHNAQTTCQNPTCSKTIYTVQWRIREGKDKYCSRECFYGYIRLRTIEKFWKLVLKTESCWLWQGRIHPMGYGIFSTHDGTKKSKTLAHRFSYELHRGEIQDGMLICHNCPGGDNKLCVNPDHLFVGTDQDNHIDRYIKQGRGHKIKAADITHIRSLEEVVSLRKVSQMFFVSCPTIKNIWTRRTFAYIPETKQD